MGCDIHMTLERKDNDKYTEVTELPCYEERDYELFSMLAGVRNRFGIIPIHENRGVPTDHSDGSNYLIDDYGDIHSTSWATLQELFDYDWSRVFTISGYTDINGYEYHKACKTTPHMYFQDTNQPKFETVEAYREYIKENPDVDKNRLAIRFHKETYYATSAMGFISYMMLYKCYCDRNKIPYTDFRLVFGFDN